MPKSASWQPKAVRGAVMVAANFRRLVVDWEVAILPLQRDELVADLIAVLHTRRIRRLIAGQARSGKGKNPFIAVACK
jgi:hypothetical protein